MEFCWLLWCLSAGNVVWDETNSAKRTLLAVGEVLCEVSSDTGDMVEQQQSQGSPLIIEFVSGPLVFYVLKLWMALRWVCLN